MPRKFKVGDVVRVRPDDLRTSTHWRGAVGVIVERQRSPHTYIVRFFAPTPYQQDLINSVKGGGLMWSDDRLEKLEAGIYPVNEP